MAKKGKIINIISPNLKKLREAQWRAWMMDVD